MYYTARAHLPFLNVGERYVHGHKRSRERPFKFNFSQERSFLFNSIQERSFT